RKRRWKRSEPDTRTKSNSYKQNFVGWQQIIRSYFPHVRKFVRMHWQNWRRKRRQGQRNQMSKPC
ncbi:hypothetical protein GCK32_018491, partial [Trichostrongylus colubriformis]